MDDRVNGFFLKHVAERIVIAAVDLIESRAHSRDGLDAVEHRDLRIRKVVDDDGRMARGKESEDGFAADETRAPRN